MEYTIITFGAQEVMADVFNAMAALINSKTGSIYQSLVRLGLFLGLFWVLGQMVYGQKGTLFKNWFVPFYVALTFFFAPTCRVHIQDPTTHQPPITVDNVPWGLGAFAGTISNLSHNVTKKIEAVFSLPDNLQYHKTGSLLASNLIAHSSKFRITDPNLQDTMREFMCQCVLYDALLGTKYTLKDLKYSPDIWKLACESPSPARAFVFKEPGRGSRAEILTCKEGVQRLRPYIEQEVENAFAYFGNRIFGKRSERHASIIDPSVELKQYLPLSYEYMTKMSRSATDLMRQQLMINAIEDAADYKNQTFGNPASFAIQRAYLLQRMNQETTFGIAVQKLVAMKNVMEALIYVAFLFILPMAMLPLGWKFISNWVGLVLWVQLWSPLYAVLHYLANAAGASKSSSYLLATEGGVTIASSIGFANLHADMAAQAGFLTLSVASLSYALVKGGAASFVHLASHLGSPATAAASKAAEDMFSGNYSFGNISEGNVQVSNHSFGQQTWAPSYTSGFISQNHGIMARMSTAEGEHIMNVANSNLRSSININDSYTQSLSAQGSHMEQLSENTMIAAGQAQMEALRQSQEFASHIAQGASAGSSFTDSVAASDRKAINTVETLNDRFAQENSIDRATASQVLLEVGIGGGALLKGGLNSTHTHSSSERELFAKAKDFVKQTGYQTALETIKNAAQEERFSKLDDTGKRLVSGIQTSSERSHQLREEASLQMQKAQSYQEMASWAKQHAGAISQSLNQEYVNWLAKQSLPNSKGSMGLHSAEHILTRDDILNHSYQERFLEERIGDITSLLKEHGYSASFDHEYVERKARFQLPENYENALKAADREGFRLGEDLDDKIQREVDRKVRESSQMVDNGILSFTENANSRQQEIESYERESIGFAEDIYEKGEKVREILKKEYPGLIQKYSE